jgi:hypothetical protein
MGINEAIEAIEKFLLTYDGGSGHPQSIKVRPSGDAIDEIKISIELGVPRTKLDIDAYESACAAAIRDAVPTASPFKLDVRAEADPSTVP